MLPWQARGGRPGRQARMASQEGKPGGQARRPRWQARRAGQVGQVPRWQARRAGHVDSVDNNITRVMLTAPRVQLVTRESPSVVIIRGCDKHLWIDSWLFSCVWTNFKHHLVIQLLIAGMAGQLVLSTRRGHPALLH
jgi:hypothetical protein